MMIMVLSVGGFNNCVAARFLPLPLHLAAAGEEEEDVGAAAAASRKYCG